MRPKKLNKRSAASRFLDDLFAAWQQTGGRFSYRNVNYYLNNQAWPWDRHYTFQALKRLENRKLIQARKTGPAIEIKITPIGLTYKLGKRSKDFLSKPAIWDGRWRLLIFDIPEKSRAQRNLLRSKLREAGFAQVQKSVWVFPYECSNFVVEVSKKYHVQGFVSIFEGKYLGDDRALKRKFKLK